MKLFLYLLFAVLLVPIQTSFAPYLSVGNVKPDLGLVAVMFIGVIEGRGAGIFMGLLIGWMLSLFSAGELWISLVTNSGGGFLGGMLTRYLSILSSIYFGLCLVVVSLLSGILAVVHFKHVDMFQLWWTVGLNIFLQAFLNGAVGGGLHWLLSTARPAYLRHE